MKRDGCDERFLCKKTGKYTLKEFDSGSVKSLIQSFWTDENPCRRFKTTT